MKRILRKRPSPAMIVAVVALVAALGGTAYAKVVITGKNIRNSTVVGADIKNKALAGRDIKNDSLGRVPIKEERLTASKFGQVNSSKVADGVNRQAVVTSAGGLSRARGATSSTRTGLGEYTVVFNRDVRTCAYFVSIGSVSTTAPGNGEIASSSQSGNANAVHVSTTNSAGTAAADRPFHVIASC